MERVVNIELPLPPEVLHPNGRTRNYGYRAALVSKARGEAAFMARQAMKGDPFKRAEIQATFYMPRRRDEDGLNSWLKNYADGLQSVVIHNDSGLSWQRPIQHTGKASGGRRGVVLTIRELP